MSRAGSDLNGRCNSLIAAFCFCSRFRRSLGKSGHKTEPLPMPSRWACCEERAVRSCASVRRPPVRRIKGRDEGGDDEFDEGFARDFMARWENRAKKACRGDLGDRFVEAINSVRSSFNTRARSRHEGGPETAHLDSRNPLR